MNDECDKCDEHDLECGFRKLDPEIIEGDYSEAYQRWSHHFNKDPEKIEECFKETAFVPFEPLFTPGIQTLNWSARIKALTQGLSESQKMLNFEKNAKNDKI